MSVPTFSYKYQTATVTTVEGLFDCSVYCITRHIILFTDLVAAFFVEDDEDNSEDDDHP